MQIPVLQKKADDTSELVLLDIQDIAYICIEKRNLVYHTKTEKFYHISTLSDLEDHLMNHGFDLTDKTNLVNFNMIKKLDATQGKIYFDEVPETQSKFATIAFIKQKLFKNKIFRAIARNTNAIMEYKIKDKSEPYSMSLSGGHLPLK